MSNYPPQYGPPGQPPYGQPGYGQPQQAYGQQPPPQQGGGCFSCIGCGLIVLILLLVACGGGAVYLYFKAADLAADAANFATNLIVDGTDLAADQKNKIKQEFGRIFTAWKAGKIDQAKAKQFVEELTKSPLIPAMMAAGADARYIAHSGLTDPEKEEARKTFNRLTTGILRESISDECSTSSWRRSASSRVSPTPTTRSPSRRAKGTGSSRRR